MEPVAADYVKSFQGKTVLAHYTSFGALKGIVENREIWLSPVSCMNDTAEVQNGKRLINQAADQGGRLWNCFMSISKNLPDLWSEISEEFYARMDHDLVETFVGCFSLVKEPWLDQDERLVIDNLTMWRAYGASGNGVVLLFDPELVLRHPLFQGAVWFSKIEYETEQMFIARAERYFSHFASVVLSLPAQDQIEYSDLIVGAFSELSFQLAVSHKHPAFKDEKEMRMIWNRKSWQPDVADAFVKAELTNDGLYERFRMSFRDESADPANSFDLSKCLKIVMLGPCEDSEMKMRAIRTVLDTNGFHETVIERSDIPFRT